MPALAMYPSWRYHRTERPRLIRSAAEEEVGWADTPAAFDAPVITSKTRFVPAPEVGANGKRLTFGAQRKAQR